MALAELERKHMKPSEKMINAVKQAKSLSQDNVHLVLDPSLFKAYFSAVVKNKYDDIEKLVNGIKIDEQSLKDCTFMNITVASKISKKVEVKMNHKDPKATISGLPILVTFLENDISANYELVSATYEVPNEQGSIIFNKFPINLTLSLSIDPKSQEVVSTIQGIDFDLNKNKNVQPSLKAKPELQAGLDALKAKLIAELEPQVKEKFSIILQGDIEALVKKMNKDSTALGVLGSYDLAALNLIQREDAKIDIEYSFKDKSANNYANVKTNDPFEL